MNDSISRQGAIDAVDAIGHIATMPDGDKCIRRSAVKYTLSMLPSAQPEQRWIPVTERLPEDIKPVIVTWKNTDPKSYYQYIVGKRFIGTAHYKNGKWFWYSSVTEDLLAEYGRCDAEEFDEAIKVLAWQPLPEAWKEGDE